MKLVDLIEYLLEPSKLQRLYQLQGINQEAIEENDLCIYMEGELSLDSPIRFIPPQESGDRIRFQKEGIEYVYLLEVYLAIEFLEDIQAQLPSNVERAESLLQYALYDA